MYRAREREITQDVPDKLTFAILFFLDTLRPCAPVNQIKVVHVFAQRVAPQALFQNGSNI